MKTALFFFFTGVLALAAAYFILDVRYDDSFNFYVKKTYFLIDRAAFIGYTAVFLVTLFSIGGLLGTGFRSRFFLLHFFVCLAAIGFIAWFLFS